MRVVLDTNCLIMAISARNEYHQVWQAFLDGKYIMCVTNEIIEEYSEVISRNISPFLSELVISAIINRKNVLMKSPSYAFHLIEADVKVGNSLIVRLFPMLNILLLTIIILMFCVAFHFQK